jgi:uncharacterized protein
MNDLEKRKLFSVLCHGSIFLSSTFFSIGVPIVVLMISSDPIVQENAKEAINFHINLFIYAILFVILIFVMIGIPLLGALFVVSLIMPIVAIVQVATNPQKPYRYPLIWRLV